MHTIQPRRAPRALATSRWVVTAMIGLAMLAVVPPAHALVAEVATSVAATAMANDEDLEAAIQSAVADVLARAVAFTPSLVQLQNARLVGGRLYLLLLIADPDGEEALDVFSGGRPIE